MVVVFGDGRGTTTVGTDSRRLSGDGCQDERLQQMTASQLASKLQQQQLSSSSSFVACFVCLFLFLLPLPPGHCDRAGVSPGPGPHPGPTRAPTNFRRKGESTSSIDERNQSRRRLWTNNWWDRCRGFPFAFNSANRALLDSVHLIYIQSLLN